MATVSAAPQPTHIIERVIAQPPTPVIEPPPPPPQPVEAVFADLDERYPVQSEDSTPTDTKKRKKGEGSQKDQIRAWLLEEKGRLDLSGSSIRKKLLALGIDVSVKHINNIKRELKPAD